MCLHSSPETACLRRDMTDETSGELPSRAEVRVPWAVSPNAMLARGKPLKIICQTNALLFNYYFNVTHKSEEILDFSQPLHLCQPLLCHLLKQPPTHTNGHTDDIM